MPPKNGSSKASKPSKEPTTKVEAVKEGPPKPEKTKVVSPKSETSKPPKSSPSKKEALKKENPKKETSKKETIKKDTPKKEAIKKEASKKVTPKKVPTKIIKKLSTKKTITKKAGKITKKGVKPTKTVKKSVIEKKAESVSPSSSAFSSYENYVMEAIQAKQTEDSKWVGFNAISCYIKTYIQEVKVGAVTKHARIAAEKLHAKGILKVKKNSFAFAAKGMKYSEKSAEKRDPVRDIKPVKKDNEKEPLKEEVQLTQSGRVSKKIFNIETPKPRKTTK